MTRLLVLVLLALAGCGRAMSITVSFPSSPPEAGPDGAPAGLRAAMTCVDITPPPGLPSFGYSAAAKHAKFRGYRTRLQAQALLVEDEAGEKVCLVTMDLGSASALLHWLVAERVAQRTGLTVDRIMMMATHTHSGPAGFLAWPLYNEHGASDMRAGFDEPLVAFLTDRIADAILEADGDLRPATVAIGATAVPYLTRNRSLPAHAANRDVPTDEAEMRRQSVDPALTMIRVDAADGSPIGVFAVYSGHPTVIGTGNDLWHADVFGVARARLARQLHPDSRSAPVVVALANGTVGDVSFRWEQQDHAEAILLADRLADPAAQLFARLGRDRDETRRIVVGRRYDEFPLPGAELEDGGRLCDWPAIGASMTAGAEDGRSGLYPLLAREGEQSWFRVSCHGAKAMAFGALQPVVVNAETAPTVAPVHVVRIGSLVLVGFPFEVTTQAGRRVRWAVEETIAEHGLAGEVDQVAVVSHTDDYASYCATMEEYELQHYEGASTLYGPNSARFLRQCAVQLADDLWAAAPQPPRPGERTFRPGKARSMMPAPRARRPVTRRITPPAPGAGACRVSWRGLPRDRIDIHAGWLVGIEVQDDTGAWSALVVDDQPENDEGLDFEIRHIRDAGATAEWTATWHYPPTLDRTRPCRFTLAPRSNLPQAASDPFHP